MAPNVIERVGLVANAEKPEALAYAARLAPELRREGFVVRGAPELLDVEGVEGPLGERLDVVVAIGGDGTLLRVAREFEAVETPILGIKIGRLGFLAEARTDDGVARRLRQGRYRVQRRMRVRARVEADGGGPEFSALNDVVVHGAGFSRMVDLEIRVDGQRMREYAADGVIAATPTGSTAYSLSAGGPVVEPTVRAILMTPLNPHTMSVRPLVLDAGQRVRIAPRGGRTPVVMTVDGQVGVELAEGSVVEVARHERDTLLMVPADYDFFALLREKL